MTNQERQTLVEGQFVRVRDDQGNEADYEVTQRPWQLGHGAWVIGLKGISGGYSLDRVVAVVEDLAEHGLRGVIQAQRKRIKTLEKALRYAADCSTVEMVRDTMRGMGADSLDGWRQALRDFASDAERHTISHEQWEADRGHGITLYASGDFFTAYFDDAAEMWGQSDDALPMFHVMVQSDSPHRTCIHAVHLTAWVQHLASICMPLQIMAMSEE